MVSDRAKIVRRHHVHLLLPQPALGEAQSALFESAVRPAGWVADPSEPSSLSLQWRRRQDTLRLQTLGWFPLLVTVGPLGRATTAHRDAAARLTAAVAGAGGRSFTDRQLADYLPQARLRWQRALTERRRLTQAERLLEARQCSRCLAWSEPSVTHCTGCRHRFTAIDDAERETAVGQASKVIDTAATVLAELARGVLLDRIDSPGTDRPVAGMVTHG
ncbi:hypothetical protein AB0L70_02470 [Kribbella sp. NPDC051952]|uniref:hypothetical protein n=1 Tax=Kribbella sp. NPDC051952 TaxID=3154851 RepID=UPI003443D429